MTKWTVNRTAARSTLKRRLKVSKADVNTKTINRAKVGNAEKLSQEDDVSKKSVALLSVLIQKSKQHNSSIRIEGLVGLRNLYNKSFREFASSHIDVALAAALSGLAELDNAVRVAALGFWKTLLDRSCKQKKSSEQCVLQAFYEPIWGYLYSCLTHIQPSVRDTGLTATYMLLKCGPRTVRTLMDRRKFLGILGATNDLYYTSGSATQKATCIHVISLTFINIINEETDETATQISTDELKYRLCKKATEDLSAQQVFHRSIEVILHFWNVIKTSDLDELQFARFLILRHAPDSTQYYDGSNNIRMLMYNHIYQTLLCLTLLAPDCFSANKKVKNILKIGLRKLTEICDQLQKNTETDEIKIILTIRTSCCLANLFAILQKDSNEIYGEDRKYSLNFIAKLKRLVDDYKENRYQESINSKGKQGIRSIRNEILDTINYANQVTADKRAGADFLKQHLFFIETLVKKSV